MKVINGELYSTKHFDKYELRIMFEIKTNKPINMGPYPYETILTVYTTEKDLMIAIELMKIRSSKNVKTMEMIHSATKEQDDLTSKLIDKTLKDW